MLNQTCISKPSVRPSLFLGLGSMKKEMISIERVLYRVEVIAWAFQRMEQESKQCLVLNINNSFTESKSQRAKNNNQCRIILPPR